MSKLKRPSFLPLSGNSLSTFNRSEFYIVPDHSPSSYSMINKFYSPTNSVESWNSPVNTPLTPFKDSNSPTTPTDFYLPYHKTPICPSVRSPEDFVVKNANQFRSSSIGFPKLSDSDHRKHISNESTNVKTSNWINNSMKLDESFKYSKSKKYSDDDESDLDDDDDNDLNTTLTTTFERNDNYETRSIGENLIKQTPTSQYDHVDQNENKEDNCPHLFKELMELAESTFIKCLQKAQLDKSRQAALAEVNPKPVYTKFCKFCKNNREPRSFYLSHTTMDKNGEITCPILQNYQCTLCGSKGKKAHTRSYCPYSKLIRERLPDINDTYEFYNKRSMIHSTDAHLFDKEFTDDISDDE